MTTRVSNTTWLEDESGAIRISNGGRRQKSLFKKYLQVGIIRQLRVLVFPRK